MRRMVPDMHAHSMHIPTHARQVLPLQWEVAPASDGTCAPGYVKQGDTCKRCPQVRARSACGYMALRPMHARLLPAHARLRPCMALMGATPPASRQGHVRAAGEAACTICAPGTFADVGLQACKPCARGNYTHWHGMTRCLWCAAPRRALAAAPPTCLGLLARAAHQQRRPPQMLTMHAAPLPARPLAPPP